MMDSDVGTLIQYYKMFGYHDAQVSYEVQYLPDGRNAVIVFHVNEGDRYRLKDKPQLVNARKEIYDQLIQLTKAKPGEPYSGKDVQHDVTEIQNYLGYQGIKADVQAIQVWSGDVPGLVEVHYEIREDKPARVGQIFIIGNDRTKMNVI